MGHGLPSPLSGLLVLALVMFGPSAVVGCVLYWRALVRFAGRVAARVVRRRRPASPPPVQVGQPIERIAHHARRLRIELATVPSGTPMARRVGLSHAYDDVLLDACRALDVPDTLSGMAPGLDRECERLHVEQVLQEAGFVVL
ncbi:hypothetical protein JCM18899A_08320 [Nocardioides sp. AN3]